MRSVGLTSEFNVKIGERPCPLGITDAVWHTDPARFIFQNLLENYSGITLAQVKATRDEVRATVNALDRVPTARDPTASHFASKQHQSWIHEFIRNSITLNVRSTLEAYDEDHDGDGIVLYYCFLQEFSGATREALVLAEEALHPMKFQPINFNQDIKAFTSYCRLHLRNILGSGGQISHTHWIRIQEALEESYTEKFRLQIMDWSKNWRKQTGEGHDWTMMQFLAKVDLEYSRLLNLNQWKTNDPNSTIVALRAELSDLKLALLAAKKDTPVPTGQPKQKPTWIPKEGQPLVVVQNGKTWKYCGKCHHWNQTHTTPEHKSKTDSTPQGAQTAQGNGASANLATTSRPGPSVLATAASLNVSAVPADSTDLSSATESYQNLDF
jgi:hypothetical protein